MPHRNKVAKLKDVAEAAGVSVAAVSRYLGGKLSLPEATSLRIDDAVNQLEYRPNPHARNLSRGRSETIGLVIPDIGNPFFAGLAAEIEKAADAQGYGVMLCVTLNRRDREMEYIERFRRNYVDGLIFMTNHKCELRLVDAINQLGRVVIVDEDVVGTRTHKIFCDNEHGGYLATRHLLEAGHTRLAFIGGPRQLLTTKERLAGYRRAISEAQSDVANVAELFGEYDVETGCASVEKLLVNAPPVTGIFFSSDEALLGGLDTLHRHRIRVPEDISVVTFDDVEPLHLFAPPITAVRQPLADIGKRSVAAVLALAAKPIETAHVERLPVTLVVRSSVVPPSAA